MTQWGFLVDKRKCTGCKACEIACKRRNGLEPGDARLRRVQYIESGEFPETKVTRFSLSCMHCADPACMKVCPAGAITKNAEDGAVIADRSKCIGCHYCYFACPFGVPQYREEDGTMVKCDLCADRRAMGLDPACAHTCFYGALKAGSLNELSEMANGAADLFAGDTDPSVVSIG